MTELVGQKKNKKLWRPKNRKGIRSPLCFCNLLTNMSVDFSFFLYLTDSSSIAMHIIIAFDRRVGQKMEKRDNGPTAAREKLGSSSGEVRELVGK
ncbi:MAG: hypothetical protein IKG51_05945 [Firmicutes bacterium]|nr:hypothetical protein [Bacillota bacterium]